MGPMYMSTYSSSRTSWSVESDLPGEVNNWNEVLNAAHHVRELEKFYTHSGLEWCCIDFWDMPLLNDAGVSFSCWSRTDPE